MRSYVMALCMLKLLDISSYIRDMVFLIYNRSSDSLDTITIRDLEIMDREKATYDYVKSHSKTALINKFDYELCIE